MAMDARTRGRRYLDHLTAADRQLLSTAATDVRTTTDGLAAAPDRVEDLLGDDAVFHAVFPDDEVDDEILVGASPFLSFAVAVHRARQELSRARWVQEWTGPRERVPVLTTGDLQAFLADPDHRLFLAELLASYTHVVGGTITYRRHGRLHRRRYNELDLASMAALLDVVDQRNRPGVYRRLGDLALFLTGVFPDHTALRAFAPIDLERLARALQPVDGGHEQLQAALEVRGAVGLLEHLGQQWYERALEATPMRGGLLATVASIGEGFVEARRVLNHLTDQHLFPFRAQWFPDSA